MIDMSLSHLAIAVYMLVIFDASNADKSISVIFVNLRNHKSSCAGAIPESITFADFISSRLLNHGVLHSASVNTVLVPLVFSYTFVSNPVYISPTLFPLNVSPTDGMYP